MAHLFIQKYMNNSLILNIQIAEIHICFIHMQFIFLTSLKSMNFFDNEFHICGRKTLGNCSNTFPIGLILGILFGFDETKHKTYY